MPTTTRPTNRPDLLLPPSLRDWLPQDHLAHYIGDTIDELDLSAVARPGGRGAGRASRAHPKAQDNSRSRQPHHEDQRGLRAVLQRPDGVDAHAQIIESRASSMASALFVYRADS